MVSIVSEGPLGFRHEQHFCGNQIWFGLLLDIGVGWFLVLPGTNAAEMQVLPSLSVVICKGCSGLAAMLAQLL
ncbi:MAG: hypothetical protein AB8B85_15295 [Paracoccaceae bacterium]